MKLTIELPACSSLHFESSLTGLMPCSALDNQGIVMAMAMLQREKAVSWHDIMNKSIP
jgi:hypothetical protein